MTVTDGCMTRNRSWFSHLMTQRGGGGGEGGWNSAAEGVKRDLAEKVAAAFC